MIKIRRGIDIPLAGAADSNIDSSSNVRNVALVGADYEGMKPTMSVSEGDTVRKGQILFSDKKTLGINFTAPASGQVVALNRGARRVFQSLVIEIDDSLEPISFDAHSPDEARALTGEAIRSQLIASGQWTALRARPYGKVADPESAPAGLFITAIDTHPLAPDPALIIAEHAEAFALGQDLLAQMADCPTYRCTAPDSGIAKGNHTRIEDSEFSGPHPAGLAGTHIHFLMGASLGKIAWTIGYQDVIAVGYLFLKGELYTDRVVGSGRP